MVNLPLGTRIIWAAVYVTTGTERLTLRSVSRRSVQISTDSRDRQHHSFRATCITNFRKNGGSRAKAAQLAAHESERTTRLYDRSDDPVTLDEIERVNSDLLTYPG